MAAISFRLCPANLYGPGDRFDPAAGHVVPGLLRRTHEAKTTGAPELTIWGTGRALREFMHVDDCADALVFLMRNYSEEHLINVGTVSIGKPAKKVAKSSAIPDVSYSTPASPTACLASCSIHRAC
jgi:GDP-L-fucose synthase